MAFVDRKSKYPGRVLITPESGEAFYATMVRADEPTAPGTPINASSLNELINRNGDTMNAQLIFDNPASYHALTKNREINGEPFSVNFGCGTVGGKGIISFEVRAGYESTSPRLGRFEVGELGVAYIDPAGTRHYLYENTVLASSVG